MVRVLVPYTTSTVDCPTARQEYGTRTSMAPHSDGDDRVLSIIIIAYGYEYE